MEIDHLPDVDRRAFFLGLLSVAALAGGCGGDQGTPAAPTEGKAKDDSEREAREKAYGKSAQPGKPGAKPKG